ALHRWLGCMQVPPCTGAPRDRRLVVTILPVSAHNLLITNPDCVIRFPHHPPERAMGDPTVPSHRHLRSRVKARQLALVVAIADERSLRRAAGVIAVTQPAATRMLAEL